MTMYQENEARTGSAKLSWEELAKVWNSDVLTELCVRDNPQSLTFPVKTLKTGSQLKKFYKSLAQLLDNEFSRMSMSAQPKLAQATLYSFATSMVHRGGIDRSGSSGASTDFIGGSNASVVPQAAAPAALGTLGHAAASSRGPAASSVNAPKPKGVGRGGKGKVKTCRLCLNIEGAVGVPLGFGHGYGDPPKCKYQQLMKTAADTKISAAESAAAYVKLDTLLREGKTPSSMLELYPKMRA